MASLPVLKQSMAAALPHNSCIGVSHSQFWDLNLPPSNPQTLFYTQHTRCLPCHAPLWYLLLWTVTFQCPCCPCWFQRRTKMLGGDALTTSHAQRGEGGEQTSTYFLLCNAALGATQQDPGGDPTGTWHQNTFTPQVNLHLETLRKECGVKPANWIRTVLHY